jgi:hypothetical protein
VACITAKGAGGRFIRGAEAGRPFARGLKALDPDGEAAALAQCRRAAALSVEAAGRTRALREALSGARILAIVAGMLRDIAAIEAAGEPVAKKKSDDPSPQEIARQIEMLRRDRQAQMAARGGQGG